MPDDMLYYIIRSGVKRDIQRQRDMSGQPSEPLFSQSHDHRRCVESALSSAEEVCATHNAQLTRLRRDVLKIVWSNHKPIGAYDILAELRTTRQRAEPPTVYRALAFLDRMHLVHKIESLNAYVGCSFAGETHASQFFICEQCHNCLEHPDRKIAGAIVRGAERLGFSVSSQTVEVLGVCQPCRESAER